MTKFLYSWISYKYIHYIKVITKGIHGKHHLQRLLFVCWVRHFFVSEIGTYLKKTKLRLNSLQVQTLTENTTEIVNGIGRNGFEQIQSNDVQELLDLKMKVWLKPTWGGNVKFTTNSRRGFKKNWKRGISFGKY